MNCPGCGAAMRLATNRRHFQCCHCGRFHVPEETDDGVIKLGEPTGDTCPRCDRVLEEALIEGQSVAHCGNCCGFVATMDAFGVIVTRRRARQGPHQKRTEPFDRAELRVPATCPGCRDRMETHPYYGGGNAVVDSCARCRLIWLDAGELTLIGSYVPHVPRIEPPLDLYREDSSDTASW